MKLYLDSSAVVKLVVTNRSRIRSEDSSGVTVTTCESRALWRSRVVRAVLDGGPAAVAHARRQLARLDQINLDRGMLDGAATLAQGRSCVRWTQFIWAPPAPSART